MPPRRSVVAALLVLAVGLALTASCSAGEEESGSTGVVEPGPTQEEELGATQEEEPGSTGQEGTGSTVAEAPSRAPTCGGPVGELSFVSHRARGALGQIIVFTRDPGSILVIGADGLDLARVPLAGRAFGVVWEPQS